jgi:hypothetical protein
VVIMHFVRFGISCQAATILKLVYAPAGARISLSHT